MASGAIPTMLDYPDVKPRGMQTQFKTFRFTPLTSFNSYVTNDIIRFWMPMIKGFWDPYKSYIELQVQVDVAQFPYGHCLQVDNSASSFISEMTISADGQQIQRIQQYDTVAAMLHDVQYTPQDQFGQQYQGIGYSSHGSQGFNLDTRQRMSGASNGQATYNTTQLGVSSTSSIPAVNPFYVSGFNPSYPLYITPQAAMLSYQSNLNAANPGASPSTLGLTGFLDPARLPRNVTATNLVQGQTNPPGMTFMPMLGPMNQISLNTSTFYADKTLLNPRPFIQTQYQSSCFGLQSTTASNMSLFGSPAYLNPVGALGSNTTVSQVISPTYGVSSVKNNGYTQAYSEQLSNSSFQPQIAPAHGQSWIHKGAFLGAPMQSQQRVFQIPIISSLMGVLIPAQSYQLLPMQALKNLMLQFRLNQHAMFTSGYLQDFTSTIGPRHTTPMGTQLQRQWKINRFQIFGAVYTFDDFVTNLISQRLASSGITMSSNAWALGPRFSLTTSSLLKNSWQINAGYESLKTLVFRIQCDDYKQYTFARKHYYLGGNVTSLQLKIANTYIPPQPILGHSGCILPTGQDKNNAPYIIEMHKAFGQLFNIGSNTYINATNFAVNDRPYDPSNKAAYFDQSTKTVTNIDTASGLSLFHQNRCVGRALYAFDLQALPHDNTVISGLNTLQYRPFQVLIDTDTSTAFTRDATLVYLLNFDVIYVLQSGDAPQVFGRG